MSIFKINKKIIISSLFILIGFFIYSKTSFAALTLSIESVAEGKTNTNIQIKATSNGGSYDIYFYPEKESTAITYLPADRTCKTDAVTPPNTTAYCKINVKSSTEGELKIRAGMTDKTTGIVILSNQISIKFSNSFTPAPPTGSQTITNSSLSITSPSLMHIQAQCLTR